MLDKICSCRQSFFLQTSLFGNISAPRQDFPTIYRAEMMPKPRGSKFQSKFGVFCYITPDSEQNSEFFESLRTLPCTTLQPDTDNE